MLRKDTYKNITYKNPSKNLFVIEYFLEEVVELVEELLGELAQFLLFP